MPDAGTYIGLRLMWSSPIDGSVTAQRTPAPRTVRDATNTYATDNPVCPSVCRSVYVRCLFIVVRMRVVVRRCFSLPPRAGSFFFSSPHASCGRRCFCVYDAAAAVRYSTSLHSLKTSPVTWPSSSVGCTDDALHSAGPPVHKTDVDGAQDGARRRDVVQENADSYLPEWMEKWTDGQANGRVNGGRIYEAGCTPASLPAPSGKHLSRQTRDCRPADQDTNRSRDGTGRRTGRPTDRRVGP